MEEITILQELPIVFTKDEKWMDQWKSREAKNGDVILLPKDAVLAIKPIIMEITCGPIAP